LVVGSEFRLLTLTHRLRSESRRWRDGGARRLVRFANIGFGLCGRVLRMRGLSESRLGLDGGARRLVRDANIGFGLLGGAGRFGVFCNGRVGLAGWSSAGVAKRS